jgi:hypothetical protein
LPAVDLILDGFGGLAELSFDEGMRLQMLAEAQIFGALILAQAPDLHQISDHLSPAYNQSMPDRLYLSCWIQKFDDAGALRQFGKMLDRFPFSKLAKRGPVLRVYAIDHTEPPLFEREFPNDTDLAAMIEAAREFMDADCACEVETFWDLWQHDGGWELRPAPVTLSCFGSDFENDQDDHFRIEFGPDALFLPMPEIEGGLRMGQSNLQSLIHLVGDLERTLKLERRQLWSESGANFAEVLKQAVGYHVN